MPNGRTRNTDKPKPSRPGHEMPEGGKPTTSPDITIPMHTSPEEHRYFDIANLYRVPKELMTEPREEFRTQPAGPTVSYKAGIPGVPNLGLNEFVNLGQNIYDISTQFKSELQRLGIERGRKTADYQQELFERGLQGKLLDVQVQQELSALGLTSIPTVGEQILGAGIQGLGRGISAYMEQRAYNQQQQKTFDFLNTSNTRVPGITPTDYSTTPYDTGVYG